MGLQFVPSHIYSDSK